MKAIRVKSCLDCPYLRSSFNRTELKCIRDVKSLKTIKIDAKKFKIPEACRLHDFSECHTCVVKNRQDILWRIVEVGFFIGTVIFFAVFN